MRPLMLRLPDDLHTQLVALAEQERRSLNSEIVVLLEGSLGKEPKSRAGTPRKPTKALGRRNT